MVISRILCLPTLFLWSCFSFSPTIAAQAIVINEVQYNNTHTLANSEGKYYDWVELYNASDEPVSLDGYYLKDGYHDDDKFVFAQHTMAPRSYLLVYCSDIAHRIANEWHAPFKLSAQKDTVFLFSNANELVDAVAPRVFPNDGTLSRRPDGADWYITTATPNVSNDAADTLVFDYKYDSLSVNIPSGFYTHSLSLSLYKQHPENQIRYTLNGEEVTVNDSMYRQPIVLGELSSSKNRYANYNKAIANPGNAIPKAQILRAQVFSAGCPASQVISNTYFIGDNSFTHGLPVVSIITDPDHLFSKKDGIYRYPNYKKRGKKWEREAHIEVFDHQLNKVIDQDAGIRIHGAGSRTSPQKSFKLFAREEYGDSTFSYPFFSQKKEVTEFSEILLKCVRDWTATMFKSGMCQYIVDELDIDYSAAESAIVLIDGEYWGIYNLRERISASYITHNYAYADDAFDLIKYTRTDSNKYDDYNTSALDLFGGVEVQNGSIDTYADLVDYLYYAQPKSSTFFAEVSQSIDISATIDYLIAELFLANIDFLDNNVFFWKPKEEGSLWRPIFYDLDGSMSSIQYDYLSELMMPHAESTNKPYWSILIFSKLLENNEFSKLFSTRYNELLRSTFSTATLTHHIDSFYSAYQNIMPLHIYRWDNPTDIVKWHENVDVLYDFAIQRPVEVFKQIRQAHFAPYLLYPNPIGELLELHFFDQVKSLDLALYSMQGQLAEQWHFNNVEAISQLHTCPNGTYILRVTIDGLSYSEKLVIKD